MMTYQEAIVELERNHLTRTRLVKDENGDVIAIHLDYAPVIKDAGLAVLKNIFEDGFKFRWMGTYFEIKKRIPKYGPKSI